MRFFQVIVICLLPLLVSCGKQSELVESESNQPIRLLLVGDPFAKALISNEEALEEKLGRELIIDTFNYDLTFIRIIQNSQDIVSSYDLCSFDVVWLGEFVERGILEPITDGYEEGRFGSPELYYPESIKVNLLNDELYGVPIESHSELLWYRTDLFEEAGLSPPKTTDELLLAAQYFHNEDDGLYGICWNAHQGQPLGQTLSHLLAAHGNIMISNGKANLDSVEAHACAVFLKKLLELSPPDILSMAWDLRIKRFAEGNAAMTYGWGARHFMASNPGLSPISGKVGFVPPPHAPGVEPITPFGQWSLGIPSNIGARKENALQVLEFLMRTETLKLLAQNGNIGTFRYDITEDPELQEIHPTYELMNYLSREGQLASEVRPAIPQWTEACEIVGTVFYKMLRGDLSTEETLRSSQERVDALLKVNKAGN